MFSAEQAQHLQQRLKVLGESADFVHEKTGISQREFVDALGLKVLLSPTFPVAKTEKLDQVLVAPLDGGPGLTYMVPSDTKLRISSSTGPVNVSRSGQVVTVEPQVEENKNSARELEAAPDVEEKKEEEEEIVTVNKKKKRKPEVVVVEEVVDIVESPVEQSQERRHSSRECVLKLKQPFPNSYEREVCSV